MNQQFSPISQMLHTLGLTREDLSKRSDEMRHFLTSQASPTLRVADRDFTRTGSLSSDPRSSSRCSDSKSSFSRSLSRSCSASLQEPSPPTTPVKKEPLENSASLRHYDSMEIVIERQRRQSRKEKRAKRDRERDSAIQSNLPPPSPSPNNVTHTPFNLGSSHSRDGRRVASVDLQDSENCQNTDVPVTPQKRMYYRERTQSNVNDLPRKEGGVNPKAETPTATHDAMPQIQPRNDCRSACNPCHPDELAEASTSRNPVTPQKHRGLAPSRDIDVHLPSSSPPPSSPLSSPSRAVVNLVSSPGPMGPPPEEDEYDRLPYKVPPGPYLPNKPDLSYAALVGQAILSSPEHRLTLQEIYDWITIVYPHYKRGETTWMNSIRHVLSTTVCFRKVPRDRSVGRTLWAIWDEDLECFKGGGFKKHLCKDILKATQTSCKGKGRARKRSEVEDDSTSNTRKMKKLKKSSTISDKSHSSTSQTSHTALPPLSHPLFPPSRPTPHHQPYYQSCIQPQPLPAEIIFPPLPPTAYTRFRNTPNLEHMPTQASTKQSPSATHVDLPSDLPAPPSDASSMLSVPELTPNRSSSSPPPSLPLTSEVDLDDYINMDQSTQKEKEIDTSGGQRISASDGVSEAETSASLDAETGDEALFRGTTLGPVQFWGRTPKRAESRSGTSQIVAEHRDDIDHQNVESAPRRFPSQPTSPDLELRSIMVDIRPHTPRPQMSPSLPLPRTPPRNPSHQISSLRTPISHKGLHMSPSASLAHYKFNLGPPPVHLYPADADEAQTKAEGDDMSDLTRTPRRRAAILAPPVTPKRLCSNAESPFRLTMGGGMGTSPFRTPGSRSVFDPHDPSALLDEELTRTATSQDDSPVGIFGKGRGSLLYDSPGALGSPGKWFKWW